MSEGPYLSVVIPTRDAPDLLAAALRSLALQDFPATSAEIVVIDDGSVEFDASTWTQLAEPFHLAVIRRETNQGRATARNHGIRQAAGEIIVFLDGDMTAAPGFLRAHADFHRAHPGEVCVGDIRFGPEIPSTTFTRYMESRGAQAYQPDEEIPFKCFVTGNSSAGRGLLIDAGLFDEEFHAYGAEDLELGYRLYGQGATFRFAGSALSLHHHLRPLGQTCELMRAYGRRSLPILVGKHPELIPLLRLDFLDAPWLSIRKQLLQLALGDLAFRCAFSVSRLLDKCVPSLLYSYMWWHCRTRGFLEARQDTQGGSADTREQTLC
jgi:glycosyltransferase involved in cell wall biosynthesis